MKIRRDLRAIKNKILSNKKNNKIKLEGKLKEKFTVQTYSKVSVRFMKKYLGKYGVNLIKGYEDDNEERKTFLTEGLKDFPQQAKESMVIKIAEPTIMHRTCNE